MSETLQNQVASAKFIEEAKEHLHETCLEKAPIKTVPDREVEEETSFQKNPIEMIPDGKVEEETCPQKDPIETIPDGKVEEESCPQKDSIETIPDGEIEEETNNEALKDETESTQDLEQDIEEKNEDEWQDILGSGVILKKILKQGEQPDLRPNRSNKCIINYSCRLEDTDEEDFAEKFENYELTLGEGDVIQGLDVALTLMAKGERCLLKIGSRLAFGERGLLPQIPSNATVMCDVELLDFLPEDYTETLTVQQRQQIGNRKRERGNWWYQRGENTLAIQCYRRALDYLDEVESEHEKPSDSELQKLLEDRLKVLNNMASAQIKMELYDQALISLETVLRCQPNNVKALFRKSKVHSAKNELPQALRLLEKARVLEPDDTSIAKEIANVTGMINKQKNSEREYARRMFGTTAGSQTEIKFAKKKKKEVRSMKNTVSEALLNT
ncbi:hypothetical protein ABEB36_006574 [Hypothenemus hampei]|uniref:peptidylprolyl isomerase n=1 Tax=Hypothenemus hampei TaxID=57062 RepID=A0ABD1ERH0_HYPHA